MIALRQKETVMNMRETCVGLERYLASKETWAGMYGVEFHY